MRNEELGMESVVFEKSKNFALRIIALYKYFCDEKREFILSKQLLRSGTSIGANIAEANCACSRKDFLAKMHIAFKESAETAYWLELLYKAQYLTQTQYDSINADCGELQKLLSSITGSELIFFILTQGKMIRVFLFQSVKEKVNGIFE